MNSELPAELMFLKQFDTDAKAEFAAHYLKTPFENDIWHITFDDPRAADITINFSILLDDGSLLTHARNANLLLAFKQFILAQTSPYLTSGKTHSDRSKNSLIQRSLHILDHFLLHSHIYPLSKNGLYSATKDNLRTMLALISSKNQIKASLYQPTESIKKFANDLVVKPSLIEKVQKKVPTIRDINNDQKTLHLSDRKIIAIRVWMYSVGYYFTSDNYRYGASLRKLLKHIWHNRILGNTKFDNLQLNDLSFQPYANVLREYPKVPVNNLEDERASEEYIMQYHKTITAMSLVNEYGVGIVNNDILDVLSEKPDYSNYDTKTRGRFSTLPFEVSRRALKDAFTFYFDNGEIIVDGIKELIRSGNSENIPYSLSSLGVKKIKLPKADLSNDEYFPLLRANTSLLNLRDVLFGACVVIFNTVMARRISELINIRLEDIVEDKSKKNVYRIGIWLRKANIGHKREYILRPIPRSVVEMLKLISKINELLNELNHNDESFIFTDFTLNTANGTCIPKIINNPANSFAHVKRWLDAFCDYCETDLDELGRRWYIRPHQLRRNFAMLFFWQGAHGGLATLSHFLGHKKYSDTYRYITESCSGKVLSKIKADITTQLILKDSDEVTDIRKFINERYGFDSFTILPESELSKIIQDLIEEGDVKIEPEFYIDDKEEVYKITYVVKRYHYE